MQLAQLAIGVLGVLAITAEYSTGMIRASITAVPKRLPVLWAKAIVYGLVVLALMIPAVLIAFFVGRRFLLAAPHQHRLLASRRRARRDRGGALPDRRRPLRARPRRDHPQHRGWDLCVRRDHVRAAAAHERVFRRAGTTPRRRTCRSPPESRSSRSRPGNHLSPWVGLAFFAGYAAAALAVAAVLLVRRDT